METIGTGYQRSGKNSRVEVELVALVRNKFDVEWSTKDLDTVSFESLGDDGNSYDEGIESIREAKFAVDGDWDAHQNAFDDPPGVYVRDDLSGLVLYLNTTDESLWSFPYSRIRSAKNTTAVRDKVGYSFSGMNQGQFTVPTGSV